MYRLVVFDMDGVLFLGNTPLPDASPAVDRLRQAGTIVRYLTNNSTQTRQFYAEKLGGFGISVSPDEIVTSASATASWMAATTEIKTVFVVGGGGLVEELQAAGMTVITRDSPTTMDETCEAVVAGLDKGFTYETLLRAQQVILRTKTFIATNRDTQYPTESGVIPGGGSIVAAIAAAAESEPITIGKPETLGLQFLLDQTGTAPDHALMVGDRLDTDIACANRIGMHSACVLTGVTTRDQANVSEGLYRPGRIIATLAEL
ncbi:MAG: HAD-IIA family hydrolase [Armatimonadota bacterium]